MSKICILHFLADQKLSVEILWSQTKVILVVRFRPLRDRTIFSDKIQNLKKILKAKIFNRKFKHQGPDKTFLDLLQWKAKPGHSSCPLREPLIQTRLILPRLLAICSWHLSMKTTEFEIVDQVIICCFEIHFIFTTYKFWEARSWGRTLNSDWSVLYVFIEIPLIDIRQVYTTLMKARDENQNSYLWFMIPGWDRDSGPFRDIPGNSRKLIPGPAPFLDRGPVSIPFHCRLFVETIEVFADHYLRWFEANLSSKWKHSNYFLFSSHFGSSKTCL